MTYLEKLLIAAETGRIAAAQSGRVVANLRLPSVDEIVFKEAFVQSERNHEWYRIDLETGESVHMPDGIRLTIPWNKLISPV